MRGEPVKYIAGHHQRLRPPQPLWDEANKCYRIPIASKKRKGFVALVDPEDIDLVKGYRWYLRGHGRVLYAYSQTYTINGKRPVFSMHRLIMGEPDQEWEVDHINHNGLDNRRQNLRLVSHQQNAMNQRGWESASSRYKGVTRNQESGVWIAKLNTNGHHMYLGRFDTEILAAHAYDTKAKEVFGEHAFLNFPENKE